MESSQSIDESVSKELSRNEVLAAVNEEGLYQHLSNSENTSFSFSQKPSKIQQEKSDKNLDSSVSDGAGSTTFPYRYDCPICLQQCIHPARLPCGHIFCFLCIKGVAYKSQRCAMCRREIPPEFLDQPQLVNGIEDISKSNCSNDGYQWFYEGRHGGWWAYDKRSSDEIEEAYCIYLKSEVFGGNHDMLISGTIYSIDFADMVQFPKNTPMRRRKICRAKNLPTKGVAGIQFVRQ